MAQQLTDPLSSHIRATGTLPLLDTVLDLDVMRARLRESSPQAGGGGLVVISARLIDCKEDRGLIAYELERSGGGERFRVFGKQFGDPLQAKRVREIQLSLWSEVFRDITHLGVPEPFGWLPDISLVLYLPVKGRHLDRAIRAGRADDALHGAAEWLARLHGSQLRLDRRFDLGTELVNLGKWADVVAVTYPEEGSAAAAILEYLRDSSVGIDLELGSPVHKDFHYRHVTLGKRFAVLDFDEMRCGDPSFDLAHFATYLRLLCIRLGWPPSRFRMLERSFLEAYARRAGWVRDERYAYFSAYTSLKIARQLCATVGVRPIPTGAERRRQLRAILEHGQALGALV